MQMSTGFYRAREHVAVATEYGEFINAARTEPHDRENLFGVDVADLLDRDALVVLRKQDGILAGLHVVLDGSRTAHIQGVRCHPLQRGRGHATRIVRESLVRCHSEWAAGEFSLVVRCDDAGAPNGSAATVYHACGFRFVGAPFWATVSGSKLDRHLGPTGGRFRVRRMGATIEAVTSARARLSTEVTP